MPASYYRCCCVLQNWTGLKQRLGPARRVYAFFHANLPREPLVILHTALCAHAPTNIRQVVTQTPEEQRACECACAVGRKLLCFSGCLRCSKLVSPAVLLSVVCCVPWAAKHLPGGQQTGDGTVQPSAALRSAAHVGGARRFCPKSVPPPDTRCRLVLLRFRIAVQLSPFSAEKEPHCSGADGHSALLHAHAGPRRIKCFRTAHHWSPCMITR